MTKGVQNKKKAHRASKKTGYYTRQYYRTIQNKIKRLRKRVDFDPTAAASIERLKNKPVPK